MNLAPLNLTDLLQFSFLATAVAYAITGTKIGFPIRVVGFHGLKWCPLPLSTIFFCPSCNAWWQGFTIGILLGWEWPSIIQLAFTSCLVAAILQLRYGLAVDDMEQIRLLFQGKKAGNNVEERRRSRQGGSERS